MRLLLMIIAIPVLIVVLALVLVPMLLDEQRVLKLAQDAIKEETGATLDVNGEVSFSLFPTIAVTLGDAVVTLPDESEPTATADTLAIGVQFMPLLSRQVEVGGILIEGFHARLKQAVAPEPSQLPDTSSMNEEQRKAYEEARQDAAADAASEQLQILAAPLALSIEELTVADSTIEMVAPEGDTTRLLVNRIHITDVNTAGRPLNMDANLVVDAGEDADPLELLAQGELIADADARTITLGDLAVTLTGAGENPVELQLNGNADLAALVADLQLTFAIGESRGEGSLRYAAVESPQIVAVLRMNLLNEALLALAGPDAATAQEQSVPEEEATGDEPLPLEAIRAMSTQFDLTVDKAVYQGYQVDALRLQGRAVDGIAEITSMTGNLFGGKLDMRATFNARGERAKLNTRGAIESVDIAALLKAAEVEANVTGTATMDWQLNSQGGTSNQLVNGLTGPANLNTEAIVLQDVGIEKMMCEAVALVNQARMTEALPESSQLEDLSAKVMMRDGNAVLDPLSIDSRGVRLRGEGSLGLLSQDFSATFAAKITEELATLDPACEVNERYTAIEWPVNCRGNLDSDPDEWCGVDTQKIIEELAKGEVKRKIEKEAGRLLDKLFKD